MQPISSDSELDLNPAPAYLPRLYLQSADVRNAYDAFQDDVTPPLSRSASPCPSESELPPDSRESDPTRMIPPRTQSIDVAPPTDEQLGLPSALSVAIDQIPSSSRLLTLAMYQAPSLALVTRFPRVKIATAVAHTLNMRRAVGGARAVLLVARTASTARQWQQQLSISLDEVKVTVFRLARAARDATLNSLRTEQFPGVIIVSDRVLRNVQLWNEICSALKQNRVVSRWQLVVSEIRGSDTALNLYHSPFRMVADNQADAGLMAVCSDDPARLRKEQISKQAVNNFVRTQLPSMTSANLDAIWLTPESILVTKTTKEAILSRTRSPNSESPECKPAHDTVSPMRDVDNKGPRRKPRRRSTDQTRSEAHSQQCDQQLPVNTSRTQRRSTRLMPRTASVPHYAKQAQEHGEMNGSLNIQKESTRLIPRTASVPHYAKQTQEIGEMKGSLNVQKESTRLTPRAASVPRYARQTQEHGEMKGSLNIQKEQASPNTSVLRKNAEALHPEKALEEEFEPKRLRSNSRSNTRSNSKRSPFPQNRTVLRRSSSKERLSVESLERRSFSIIDVSDDSDSGDEWFTPPSRIIPASTLPDHADFFSDEDNWRTPFTSRKQTRAASSRASSRRSTQRLNRRLVEDAVHDKDHEEATSVFSRNGSFEHIGRVSRAQVEPVRRTLSTTKGNTPLKSTTPDKESAEGVTDSRRRRVPSGARPAAGVGVQPLADVENMALPSRIRKKKMTRKGKPEETPQSSDRRAAFEASQKLARNRTPTGNRRNTTFIQIPDSDVEVIDCDVDVIDLCSDEESLTRQSSHQHSQKNLRDNYPTSSHHYPPHNGSIDDTPVQNGTGVYQADQRGNRRSSSVEFVDECEDQSLILSGVLKMNPHTRSLTEDQRRQFNKWLRKARASEARGPDGYSVAIRLYSKCLELCDKNDYLTSRILSLSQEIKILSFKDFVYPRSSSRIAKKPHSPKRRRRGRQSGGSS